MQFSGKFHYNSVIYNSNKVSKSDIEEVAFKYAKYFRVEPVKSKRRT